ncbi:hypothetical protein Tco_0753336 [Tanacetum coccineum]
MRLAVFKEVKGEDRKVSYKSVIGNSEKDTMTSMNDGGILVLGNIMAEGDIDNLTMEQYLALSRGNQASGVVKPEIRGNAVFPLGAHLDKECPLNEEVKSVEEVKYGEFGRSFPLSNGAKYHVGPPGYYTIDNRPPFREKRPSLEKLMSKHLEESIRRRAEMEEWVKKLQENAEINTRNQSACLKNLETQIEQLTKEFQAKTVSEVPKSSVGQCKAV